MECMCHGCGEIILKDHAEIIGNEYFCDDCSRAWVECSDCSRAIRKPHAYITYDGRYICGDCRDSSYHICESCGDLYHEDDGWYCNDSNWRCGNCAEEYDEAHRSNSVLDYHDFDRSNYLPRVMPGEDESKTMLFGVELEVDEGELDVDDFSRWKDDQCLIHFENDGSLSDNGVECITMPCSLRFHQEKMDWKTLCQRFKNQGFKSHDCDSCGLHVHMSRALLTPIQIIKMDVFVNRCSDFWSQIGRRSYIYGGSFNKCKHAHKAKAFDRFFEDRYVPVNTKNRNTVELRFPKGTLNHETILGTIELFDAMPKFLDTIPICKIYDTDKNISEYVKFVCEEKKYRYAVGMMKRLVRKGPCKPIVEKYYGKLLAVNNDSEQ